MENKVDKTAVVKTVLDDPARVVALHAPCNFGKTAAMKTLERYLNVLSTDSFETTEIWTVDSGKYQRYRGRYPVIHFSLVTLDYSCYDDMLTDMAYVMTMIYNQHYRVLYHSACLTEDEKKDYLAASIKMDGADVKGALRKLIGLLHRHYRRKPIVLIDEYDTPDYFSWEHGFCREWTALLNSVFREAFADDSPFKKAVVFGIFPVRETFSGLSSITLQGITDTRYSRYFGLSREEVKEIVGDRWDTDGDRLTQWYGGYRIGDQLVYRPDAIQDYMKNDYDFCQGWYNFFCEHYRVATDDFKALFRALLSHGVMVDSLESLESLQPGRPDAITADQLLYRLLTNAFVTWRPVGDRLRLEIPNAQARRFFQDHVDDWERPE